MPAPPGADRIDARKYGRWKKRLAAHTARPFDASRLKNQTPDFPSRST